MNEPRVRSVFLSMPLNEKTIGIGGVDIGPAAEISDGGVRYPNCEVRAHLSPDPAARSLAKTVTP